MIKYALSYTNIHRHISVVSPTIIRVFSYKNTDNIKQFNKLHKQNCLMLHLTHQVGLLIQLVRMLYIICMLVKHPVVCRRSDRNVSVNISTR